MSEFVELFEKGDFVELGLEIYNEFKRIDKDKRIPRNKKYETKYNTVIKKLTEKYDPVRKSEDFFKLNDWDINKLSFIIATDSVARSLKTSQIRRILNMSTAIYRKIKEQKSGQSVTREITKLSYTLAYTLGRHKELEPLARVLNKAVSKLNDEKDYVKVHDFLQAVVAYHKLLGGD
ncbi:type III-A CRISPR-associated protein Csm2 [Archaeoglobales archaeon]|nr:MAG: type III-A CRISPR-associated protein Csm2 [Archaeoglobales archaeon]